MKKILLLSLFTFTLTVSAERPEMRKITERLSELKVLTSSHCDDLGSYKKACKADFDSRMNKKIRAINKAMIHDYDNKAIGKVHAEINEEKLVAKYSKFLDKHGVSYGPSETSDDLKIKFDLKKTELAIARELESLREELDSLGVVYLPTDDSDKLREKRRAYYDALLIGSGSGSGQ